MTNEELDVVELWDFTDGFQNKYGGKPTREDIYDGIIEFRKTAKPGDMVVIDDYIILRKHPDADVIEVAKIVSSIAF